MKKRRRQKALKTPRSPYRLPKKGEPETNTDDSPAKKKPPRLFTLRRSPLQMLESLLWRLTSSSPSSHPR